MLSFGTGDWDGDGDVMGCNNDSRVAVTMAVVDVSTQCDGSEREIMCGRDVVVSWGSGLERLDRWVICTSTTITLTTIAQPVNP